MEELTLENVEIGLKVVRGPGWNWGDQDVGSLFGIILDIAGNTIRISWSSNNQRELRRDTYRISSGVPKRACFYIYDGKPKKPVIEHGVDFEIIEKQDIFNSTVERVIDEIVDWDLQTVKDVNLLIDKIQCLKIKEDAYTETK